MQTTLGRLRIGITRPGYFRMGREGWHFSLLPIISVAWDRSYWRSPVSSSDNPKGEPPL